MRKHIINLQVLTLVATVIGITPVLCSAQKATNQAPPHKFADEAEGRDYDLFQNFEGPITKVDLKKKMITVKCEGRRFMPMRITPDTKFTKDGKPATLKDAVVGGTVSGVAGLEKDKIDAINLDFKSGPKAEENGDSSVPKK